DPGISTPCFFLHLEHRHLSSFWLAPSSPQRRQLDNPPSQVRTLNLSTPGGCCYNNLLVFPVPVLDYFVDNKNRKTFPSECSLEQWAVTVWSFLGLRVLLRDPTTETDGTGVRMGNTPVT
ncbi:hypothetical protein ATANTOWER_014891, partial [Ataeniobius toweri]|nr:hypothetical protein [Ataeniobius toweri]